jgi:hypothetical protein
MCRLRSCGGEIVRLILETGLYMLCKIIFDEGSCLTARLSLRSSRFDLANINEL